MDFVSKFFSQTFTVRLSICHLKFLSTSRSFVITLIHASQVFFAKSYSPVGIWKIPAPVCFRICAATKYRAVGSRHLVEFAKSMLL